MADARPRLVYRVVRADPPDRRDFMPTAAFGKRYRSSRQEELASGISVFAQLEQARRHARRYSLGAFVAEIALPPNVAIRRTQRRTAGHFTVWADADDVREHVQRVVSVD